MGDANKTEKKSLWEKVKEHKVEIAIGTSVIASAVAVMLISKNRTAIEGLKVTDVLNSSPDLKSSIVPPVVKIAECGITNNSVVEKIIDVDGHLRNLQEGRHASAFKLATAAEHGYNLSFNQTWVVPYFKKSA